MKYIIQHAPLSGTITVPPSKSHTMRAIVFATLAEGVSHLENILPSPDVEAMVTACRQFGATITQTANTLTITGTAGRPHAAAAMTIDAGNSGQVLRFIAGLAALSHTPVTITGDASIQHNRPMQDVIDGITQRHGHVRCMQHAGYAPLTVQGPIQPGTMTLDGAHAQPISSMLIACSQLQAASTIHVRAPRETQWVGLTLDWFDRLGIAYINHGFQTFELPGQAHIEGFDCHIPGDWSSAAFPMAAALVTKSTLTVQHLDQGDAQGDKQIIDALQAMGAHIDIQGDTLTIHTPTRPLQGTTLNMDTMIDALPILAVVACFAEGTTILNHAGAARKKESDRLATMTQELRKLGARVEEKSDQLIIEGGHSLHAGVVNGHQDHRVAMALSVAAMGMSASSTIEGVGCIAKSYPAFQDAMRQVGGKITPRHN